MFVRARYGYQVVVCDCCDRGPIRDRFTNPQGMAAVPSVATAYQVTSARKITNNPLFAPMMMWNRAFFAERLGPASRHRDHGAVSVIISANGLQPDRVARRLWYARNMCQRIPP